MNIQLIPKRCSNFNSTSSLCYQMAASKDQFADTLLLISNIPLFVFILFLYYKIPLTIKILKKSHSVILQTYYLLVWIIICFNINYTIFAFILRFFRYFLNFQNVNNIFQVFPYSLIITGLQSIKYCSFVLFTKFCRNNHHDLYYS
jgi:hypothetical protein